MQIKIQGQMLEVTPLQLERLNRLMAEFVVLDEKYNSKTESYEYIPEDGVRFEIAVVSKVEGNIVEV